MEKLQRRKVCRYYARGKCVKEDCPFVHQAETKKPCKFWVESGYCRKGKNCQFYHATKQEEKKDKIFMQKNKNEGQQKIQRNFQNQKKNDQNNNDQKKRLQKLQQQNNQSNQQTKEQENINSNEQKIDSQTNLKLQQQMLKQLQSQQDSKLQFFKQYPKTFPDHSKTLESKQHIKKVQQKYFSKKTFLQLLKQTQLKQDQQYYQIIRRYQDSFKLVQKEGEQQNNQRRYYVVRIRPLLYNKEMTMHFVFEQNAVEIQVNQVGYPKQRARFQILNPSIPSGYKKRFIQLIDKYHSTHTVFDTLKYFQNNFQKLYQTAKFRLQNQHFKKIQLKQKIEQQKQKIKQQENQKQLGKKQQDQKQKQQKENEQHHHQQVKKNNNDKKHQKHHNRDDNNNEGHHDKQQKLPEKIKPKPSKDNQQQQNNNHVIQKPKKQFRDYFELDFNQHQKPQHQNLNDEITVDSLVMHNCPYLVVEKILLYIECNCSKVLMYLFDAEQKNQLKLWIKLRCKKCNDCVRIVWERAVIHNKGQQLSRMSFANGKLVDIGGLGWKVGCNCDAEIIKPKLYLPGQKMQLNCHSCFSNMSVQYNGIKHFNPFVKQFQLQEDKQLPLRGSCNHDKLNFRWMRYACCGRPFACDQCHDINAVKQHEIFNGLTMICGFCAHQQSISDTCAKCRKDLIKGQDKAGHWQGGLGCRDQQLLSKKDGKKYAGMGKVESNNKKKKQK